MIQFVREECFKVFGKQSQPFCGEAIYLEFLKSILLFHDKQHYDLNIFSVLLIQ